MTYKVVDKRGIEPTPESCRVCGGPITTDKKGIPNHSREYNKPTMDCIRYLRGRIQELEKQAK
jgi:hypothetical protein